MLPPVAGPAVHESGMGMDVLTALVVLLTIVVAIDTLLTFGIVRRLRYGDTGIGESGASTWLRPGFLVDPSRDEARWSKDLESVLRGDWLVVLTLFGCPTCETVRRELMARAPLGVKVCVLVDPTTGSAQQLETYLDSWEVDLRAVAPAAYDVMMSLGGGPLAYPALALIRDGSVVQTGSRVRQLDQLMTPHPAAP